MIMPHMTCHLWTQCSFGSVKNPALLYLQLSCEECLCLSVSLCVFSHHIDLLSFWEITVQSARREATLPSQVRKNEKASPFSMYFQFSLDDVCGGNRFKDWPMLNRFSNWPVKTMFVRYSLVKPARWLLPGCRSPCRNYNCDGVWA